MKTKKTIPNGIKKSNFLLSVLVAIFGMLLFANSAKATTCAITSGVPFTIAGGGTCTWTIPSGASNITATIKGAGGGGGGDSDGSGAWPGLSGDAVSGTISNVTPGSTSLTIVIGGGGGAGDNEWDYGVGGYPDGQDGYYDDDGGGGGSSKSSISVGGATVAQAAGGSGGEGGGECSDAGSCDGIGSDPSSGGDVYSSATGTSYFSGTLTAGGGGSGGSAGAQGQEEPSNGTDGSVTITWSTGPVNGVCATALNGTNNNNLTSLPSDAALCTAGTASHSTFTAGTSPTTINWSCVGLDGGSTASGCSATVNTYAVSSSVTGGNGSVSCTSPVFSGGSSTCTITPNSGYALNTFTDNGTNMFGSVSGNSYTISNVTANHTIAATFVAVNTVTVTQNSNGTISPSTASYVQGTNPAFLITASTGYYISAITIDGSNISLASPNTAPLSGASTTTLAALGTVINTVSYTFSNLQANHTISATFSAEVITITTSSSGSGGSISPTPTTTSNYGTTPSISVTLNSGFKATMSGTCGGTPSSGMSSFSYVVTALTQDCTVVATFGSAYTITVNAVTVPSSAAGITQINSTGANDATMKSAVNIVGTNTVTITPNSGYYILSVTDTVGSNAPVQVGTGTTASGSSFVYSIPNVSANHTISATFASGTFLSKSVYTSNPIAIANTSMGFGSLVWNPVAASGNILEMRVRSCGDSGCASAPAWSSCGVIIKGDSAGTTADPVSLGGTPNLANGTNCLTPGQTYVQYQVSMATTVNTSVPTFGPVTIKNNSGVSQYWQTLESSPFNTNNPYSALGSLQWTGGATNANVKLQMRTAPDDGTGNPNWSAGSGWCGATGSCTQTLGSPEVAGSWTTNDYNPLGVAIDSSGYIWVANNATSSVSKINPSTGTVITTITSNGVDGNGIKNAAFIAADNNGYIWVAGNNWNVVYKINTATNTVVAAITLSYNASAIAVDNTDGYVAVGVFSNISVISMATDTVVNTFSIGSSNYPTTLAFDNVNKALWVGVPVSSNNLLKLSLPSGAAISGYPITDGNSPTAIAIDNINNVAWVATGNTSGVIENVSLTSTTPLSTFQSAASLGSYVYALAVDSSTGRGYVWASSANSGGINLRRITIQGDAVKTFAINNNTSYAVAVDTVNGFAWAVAVGTYSPSVNGALSKIYEGDASTLSNFYASSGSGANSVQTTRTGNQWVQYALFIQSTNGSVPSPVTNITTNFSYNSPPTVSGSASSSIPPTIAQITSGANASMVNATYYLSDVDVGSSDAPSTSDYQMLLYQPDGITLQNAITDTTGTGNILLNNPNSRPVPTSGYIMIDSELIKYASASTASGTTTLYGISRAKAFDDVTSGSSYPTIGATHTSTTPVFFRTSTTTTTFSSGAAVNSSVTATPTQYSITWNAASEPNMSAPISGTSVPPWTNWKFKVAAADGNYGTDAGTSPATTLTTLDLQPPTIASAVAGGSGKTLASNAFINSNVINLKMSEPLGYLTSSTVPTPLSTQYAQISFTPTAGGSTITTTLTTGNCSAISTTAQPLTTSGLTTNTSYNVAIQGTDLYGNTFSQAYTNVTYDTTAPYMTSISAVAGNKSYSLGAKVLVNVNMSEPVSTGSSWSLTLQAGSNTEPCVGTVVNVGSETATLTCTYTVQSGDDTTNLHVKSSSGVITGMTGYGNILDRAGNAMTNDGTGSGSGKITVGFNDLSQSNVVIDTHSQEKISGTVGFNGSARINSLAQCSASTGSGQFCTFGGLIYGTVTAADGRVWMDRNLGATEVANGYYDSNAFGWYYQWGRRSDGHQLSTRTSPTGTTATLASNDNPYPNGNGLFILGYLTGGYYDWHSSGNQNDNLWDCMTSNIASSGSCVGTDVNDPCPPGFHVPTQAEWANVISKENIVSDYSALHSTLVLPENSWRASDTGIFGSQYQAEYWSSTPITGTGGARDFYFDNTGSVQANDDSGRANGFAVRCIKN